MPSKRKTGKAATRRAALATEIAQAEIAVDAVLYEADIPLKQLMTLKVGDTLPLNVRPDAQVSVRCGNVTLSEGRMGRVGYKFDRWLGTVLLQKNLR